jgi:hypothetical protein
MAMSIEEALLSYIERPDDAAVARLRRLLEPGLVARLSNLSTDGRVIAEAVDETFRLFASTMTPSWKVNWRAWIAAHALAFVAERTRLLSWVDGFSLDLPDPHERRALVFRVILTLDGSCQWSLLERARGGARAADSCQEDLNERLRRMRVAP